MSFPPFFAFYGGNLLPKKLGIDCWNKHRGTDREVIPVYFDTHTVRTKFKYL